jgi:hypothetical protein
MAGAHKLPTHSHQYTLQQLSTGCKTTHTESGPEEPSGEQQLQCRAVVGVASLAALTACAADEFEGGGVLGTVQVGVQLLLCELC